MTVFEFTFGLIAIIMGLALTDIAGSFHRLVMNRAVVRWHPLPLLAAAMALTGVILAWWSYWSDRSHRAVTFAGLVYEVGQALVLYLLAAASLPDKVDEGEGVDLGAYYDQVRPYYMSLLAAYVLMAGPIAAVREILAGENAWEGLFLNAGMVALFVACIFIRARWFNLLVLVSTLGLLGVRWWAIQLRG